MIRILSGAILMVCLGYATGAEPPKADSKLTARVKELIRELGTDDFGHRQEAQKRLEALGPVVLPILDSLEPFADSEVAFRIREVRRAVGGVGAELRRVLEAYAPLLTGSESRQELGPRTLKLIAAHTPEAGDFLLTLVADPKQPLHRSAVNAFVQAWGVMTPDQIRTYLERSFLFSIAHRPAYPKGVDAMIGVTYRFRHGWGSLPLPTEGLKIATETIHTLDGKPYGAPFRYPHTSSGCTTGWIRTKDLAVGRHSLSAETQFEVMHAGKKVAGSVKSAAYTFDVLPADTPDDLAGPKDAALEKRVRAALWIAETEEPKAQLPNFNPGGGAEIDWWRPQITWTAKDGKPNGLHLPVWRLDAALPVDLAFDVSLRIVSTGEEFPADTLVAVKGVTRNLGYIFVRDAEAVAKGRSGFVPVRIVLRPSRAAAVTDTKVTEYFTGEIVSEPFRMKVGPTQDAPPPK